jgi:glycosyltransferase involved in cell wall biosynthesis
MRILVVHNRYQQRGGEDAVAEDEAALLAAGGHDVSTVFVSNDAIASLADKVRAAVNVADGPAAALVVEAVRRHRPDVVHVHNFFPLISPQVHARVRALGPATVQTLHNFRITCAGGLLLRAGQPCELCVEGSALNAVAHRCYRGSFLGSAATAHMIARHKCERTWQRHVDRFIALSHFGRGIFERAGVPAGKIVVKPNAVDDPGASSGARRAGVLYVGRLSEEKGVAVLAAAARLTSAVITVVGDGPLRTLASSAPTTLTFAGAMPRGEARAMMARAAAVVVPSICYENFPAVVAEAFAAGTPVIASRIGALAEIIEDGRTGWLAAPGDPAALAAAIGAAVADPDESARRGTSARRVYAGRYTLPVALSALEAVYAEALAARHATRTSGTHDPARFAVHQTRETAG